MTDSGRQIGVLAAKELALTIQAILAADVLANAVSQLRGLQIVDQCAAATKNEIGSRNSDLVSAP